MAIRTVVTRGYGAGASIALVATRGYIAGPEIISTAVRPAGGWEQGFASIFDRFTAEKREKRQERRIARQEIKKIKDETDAEIARLMHEILEYDARTQEMDQLEEMMRKHDTRVERAVLREFNEDVEIAYGRAMKLGTFASAEAFERAMERALEEEEFLLLAIATLH